MNTRKLLVSVLMLVSVLLSACASATATPPAPTAVPATAIPPTVAPTVAPVQNQTTFSSKKYDLKMSVSFGPDWHVLDDYSDLVTLQWVTGDQLGFNIVTNAKLADPLDGHQVPFPDDFMSWIKSDPDLVADKATEVMVGGIKGTQIDIRSTTMLKQQKGFVYLTSGIIWNIAPPVIGRFTLLNDVNGERVFIWFVPPPDQFTLAVGQAQPIIDSVVFRP